jgi:hypothetical protein
MEYPTAWSITNQQHGSPLGLDNVQPSPFSGSALCNSCQTLLQRPLEQLQPVVVEADERYALFQLPSQTRLTKDVRASVDFGCRICSLYWELTSRTVTIESIGLIPVTDQREQKMGILLEWDKESSLFRSLTVGSRSQYATHFRLLPFCM